jgi:hypothetical protein
MAEHSRGQPTEFAFQSICKDDVGNRSALSHKSSLVLRQRVVTTKSPPPDLVRVVWAEHKGAQTKLWAQRRRDGSSPLEVSD